MKSNNGQRGNLALIVGTAILLVIVGVGFLFFTLFLGGGRETQNAVDAGALNAAKVALIRPGVGADQLTSNEKQFLGVANKVSQVNPPFALGNINRVWGQALLVAINLRAMEAESTQLSNAASHAQQVIEGAKTINDQLSDKLDPKGASLDPALQQAFVDVANLNSVRMLDVGAKKGGTSSSGSSVSVSPSGNKAAYADVSNASNINLDEAQFNGILSDWAGLNVAGAFRTQILDALSSKSKNIGGKKFINGYENIDLGNNLAVYFVPLQPNARPRMISQSDVSFDPPNLTVTKKPVPNAFLSRGRAPSQKTGDLLDFAAIALAEPLDIVHQVAIPNGFIKIKNWPGFRWQGSGVNAALRRAVTIHDDGRSDGRIQDRGLHAVEYANHQLLLARADFDPYRNAPAFSGVADELVENMENPYSVLMTGPNTPIVNAENHLVFCMESELAELTRARAADDPLRDDPAPPNNTCGGLIQPNAPLPPSISCTDLTGVIGGAKSIVTGVKLLFNRDIDFNVEPPRLLGAAAGDPILQRLAQELGLAHGNNDTVFGSKNHPHIWSVYPPKDGPDTAAILDIGKAQPGAEDITDARLMYTGVLKMPNTQGQPRVSRFPNSGRDNPILFGEAITLSEAIDPPGGDPALRVIRERIVQRCKEIDPDFSGNLREFTTRINMGQDAYIYKPEGAGKGQLAMVVVKANTTNDLPDPLRDLVEASSVDGKPAPGATIVYDCYGNVTSDNKTLTAPGLINLGSTGGMRGDWGYDLPYQNADQPQGAEMARLLMWNKFVFRPCTGFQGLLGVLEMKSFITNGNDGCEKIGNTKVTENGTFDPGSKTYVTREYSGKTMAIPEDCPCVSFKKGTYPAAGSMQTGATPGPWPGMNACGGPTPDDLPNCSHTGAC